MKVELHPDAAQRFDERGNKLRALLRKIDRVELRPKEVKFTSERKSVAHIGVGDLQDVAIVREFNSLTGERTRLLFDDGAHAYELGRDGCLELEALVSAILKIPGLFRIVSASWVDDAIRRWLDPKGQDGMSLSKRLVTAIESTVRRYTVWVPISHLQVQTEFEFGGVVFRPITAAFFDRWEAACSPSTAEDAAKFAKRLMELRREAQGLTAVTFEIEAETGKVRQVAAQTAERVTALLRTMCVENLHPRACSYCVPLGRLTAINDYHWFSENPPLFSTNRELLPPLPSVWVIADEHLEVLKECGFHALSDIARSGGFDFEKKLVEALLIYNRANISRDPVDKLIFILVSLESMLLKSETEPIQSSIGERLAFVVGGDADERMAIAQLVRQCYGIRSRYIHHGEAREDVVAMERFMRYAWEFFLRLIAAHKKFSSKEALLDQLDRRKFE